MTKNRNLFKCGCPGGTPKGIIITRRRTEKILGDVYRIYEWDECYECKRRVTDFSVRSVKIEPKRKD